MTYFEKLKDPRWQKKRLIILERDNWKCRNCYNANDTLHVHHFYYTKNTAPWNYPDEHLKTLCDSCHQFYHDQLNELMQGFAECETTALFNFLNTHKDSHIKTINNEYEQELIRMRKWLKD